MRDESTLTCNFEVDKRDFKFVDLGVVEWVDGSKRLRIRQLSKLLEYFSDCLGGDVRCIKGALLFPRRFEQ